MKPVYVAITSFKGGVGCSTLTVLLASRLHYELRKRVAIIDCDNLVNFCGSLRSSEIKHPSEYPILNANVNSALSIAKNLPDDTEIVFFDIPKSGSFSLIWKMDIVYFPIEETMVSAKWLCSLFQMVRDAKDKGVKTFFRAFLTKCSTSSNSRLWNMVTAEHIGFDVKILILEFKIPEKKYFTMTRYNNLVCVSTEAPMDFNLIKKISIHPLEADLIKISKLLINEKNRKQ